MKVSSSQASWFLREALQSSYELSFIFISRATLIFMMILPFSRAYPITYLFIFAYFKAIPLIGYSIFFISQRL
jgi:hypothetical protein